MPSKASKAALSNLLMAEDLESYLSVTARGAAGTEKKGALRKEDRSLLLASTVLVYAAWEGYTEQLAVEAVQAIKRIDLEKVPAQVKDLLSRGQVDPWSFAGDRWRTIWEDRVKLDALGSQGNTPPWGMNTASHENVEKLFALMALKPFRGVSWKNFDADDVRDRVNALVSDRGQIAHTATKPQGLNLAKVRGYRAFVKRAVPLIDTSVGSQVQNLAGRVPW